MKPPYSSTAPAPVYLDGLVQDAVLVLHRMHALHRRDGVANPANKDKLGALFRPRVGSPRDRAGRRRCQYVREPLRLIPPRHAPNGRPQVAIEDVAIAELVFKAGRVALAKAVQAQVRRVLEQRPAPIAA